MLADGTLRQDTQARLSFSMHGRNYMNRDPLKVQRFAVQLPCRLVSNEDKSDGTVLNFSAQGCAITAGQLPSVSTYVSLEVELLHGESPARVELAGVRWISGHRCGLELSDFPGNVAAAASICSVVGEDTLRQTAASYLTATARTWRYVVRPFRTF
jgi:hypothetical protein